MKGMESSNINMAVYNCKTNPIVVSAKSDSITPNLRQTVKGVCYAVCYFIMPPVVLPDVIFLDF